MVGLWLLKDKIQLRVRARNTESALIGCNGLFTFSNQSDETYIFLLLPHNTQNWTHNLSAMVAFELKLQLMRCFPKLFWQLQPNHNSSKSNVMPIWTNDTLSWGKNRHTHKGLFLWRLKIWMFLFPFLKKENFLQLSKWLSPLFFKFSDVAHKLQRTVVVHPTPPHWLQLYLLNFFINWQPTWYCHPSPSVIDLKHDKQIAFKQVLFASHIWFVCWEKAMQTNSHNMLLWTCLQFSVQQPKWRLRLFVTFALKNLLRIYNR